MRVSDSFKASSNPNNPTTTKHHVYTHPPTFSILQANAPTSPFKPVIRRAASALTAPGQPPRQTSPSYSMHASPGGTRLHASPYANSNTASPAAAYAQSPAGTGAAVSTAQLSAASMANPHVVHHLPPPGSGAGRVPADPSAAARQGKSLLRGASEPANLRGPWRSHEDLPTAVAATGASIKFNISF